jgi:aminoglycoside phosphotransferase (APT) family kinase protein
VTTPESAATSPLGADVLRVHDWLVKQGIPIGWPLAVNVIAGGRSNLTARIVDPEGHTVVLRRPPLAGALPSAHDMGRESRVLTALAPTHVPVPLVLAQCDDTTVIGAPFYVMEFVEGCVVRTAVDARELLTPEARRQSALAMVDTLAELHMIDPASVGLGDLGPGVRYVERQLRRWLRQWELGSGVAEDTVRSLHAALSERVPQQERVSVVHGDYRLDNLVLGTDGGVRAVLDWELATLGDPLADLGLTLAYWRNDVGESGAMASQPAGVPGYPDADTLVERYRMALGIDGPDLAFYVAFGYWRNAIILFNVDARYRAGAYPESDDSVQSLPDRARSCLRLARRALDYS